MNTCLDKLFYTSALALCVTGSSVSAAVYFEENFESFDINAVTSQVNQPLLGKFTMPPVFADIFGPGGLFEISDAASMSGTRSMRYNYSGNNGICNTCGGKIIRHAAGHDGATYLVDRDGRDLTAFDDPTTSSSTRDGARASKNRFVVNTSDGYTKWRITKVTSEGGGVNNRLDLELVEDQRDGSPANGFFANDSGRVMRQCGVDGNVALNQPGRMSDCNAAITWWGGKDLYNAARPAGSRDPYFRRVYLRPDISSELVHTKLRYTIFTRDDGAGNTTSTNIIVVAQADAGDNGAITPRITNLRRYHPTFFDDPDNNPLPFIYRSGREFPLVEFERGEWYYMEEEIKPESANRADDGYYRLWIRKVGNEPAVDCDPAEAILELTGMSIPPISWSSFWGNTQHSTPTIGSWYIDDFRAADTCGGKVSQGTNPKNSVAVPSSP